MATFQYRLLRVPLPVRSAALGALEAALNGLGAAKWEAVSMVVLEAAPGEQPRFELVVLLKQ